MEETGDLLGNSEKNKECAETELELFKEQTWNEDIEKRGGGAITKMALTEKDGGEGALRANFNWRVVRS